MVHNINYFKLGEKPLYQLETHRVTFCMCLQIILLILKNDKYEKILIAYLVLLLYNAFIRIYNLIFFFEINKRNSGKIKNETREEF